MLAHDNQHYESIAMITKEAFAANDSQWMMRIIIEWN